MRGVKQNFIKISAVEPSKIHNRPLANLLVIFPPPVFGRGNFGRTSQLRE